MSRIPTVKIRRKRDGDVKILNQTDYYRERSRYDRKGYEIVSLKRGDGTDAQVEATRAAQELEETRRRDPEREKRFGDNQRAFDERSVRVSAVPEREQAAPDDDSDEAVRETIAHADEALAASQVEPEPDDEEVKLTPEQVWNKIQALPWLEARARVREIKGTVPHSWRRAKELILE